MERRLAGAFVGAVLVHGTLLAVLGARREAPAQASPAPVATVEWIDAVDGSDLTTTAVPPPEHPEAAIRAPGASSDANESARVASRMEPRVGVSREPIDDSTPRTEGSAGGGRDPRGAGPAPESVPSAGERGEGGAPSSVVASKGKTLPSLPGDALIPSLVGAAGSHAIIFPSGGGGSPEAAAAKKLDRALAAQIDAASGGVYGGPVANLAREVTPGSDAPNVGRATLDVVFDASGLVSRVDVVAHDDLVGWSSMARALKKKLEGRTIRVPPGSGLVVRVNVESALKLPSGATTATPSVHLEGIGVGGTFDLADVGQKPARVVAVKIVSERRVD